MALREAGLWEPPAPGDGEAKETHQAGKQTRWRQQGGPGHTAHSAGDALTHGSSPPFPLPARGHLAHRVTPTYLGSESFARPATALPRAASGLAAPTARGLCLCSRWPRVSCPGDVASTVWPSCPICCPTVPDAHQAGHAPWFAGEQGGNCERASRVQDSPPPLRFEATREGRTKIPEAQRLPKEDGCPPTVSPQPTDPLAAAKEPVCVPKMHNPPARSSSTQLGGVDATLPPSPFCGAADLSFLWG